MTNKEVHVYTLDEIEVVLPLFRDVMLKNLNLSKHKDYKDMYRPIQKKLLKEMYCALKKVSSDLIKYQAMVYDSK